MKIEILQPNCFGVIDGVLQQLPIGHVLESDRNPYGVKARVIEDNQLTLEVATPEPVPEEGSDHESDLRQFIYDKTGKHPGGRSTIATLEKQAKKLGWTE